MKSLKNWMMAAVFAGVALPVLAQSAAVIVNPKHGGGLTSEQVSNIYLGKSSDLIGVDLPDGNPLRDVVYQKVTGKDAAQVKAYWAKLVFTGKAQPLKELSSDAEVKKFVAASTVGGSPGRKC